MKSGICQQNQIFFAACEIRSALGSLRDFFNKSFVWFDMCGYINFFIWSTRSLFCFSLSFFQGALSSLEIAVSVLFFTGSYAIFYVNCLFGDSINETVGQFLLYLGAKYFISVSYSFRAALFLEKLSARLGTFIRNTSNPFCTSSSCKPTGLWT